MNNFSEEDVLKKIEQAYSEIYKIPSVKKNMEFVENNEKLKMAMNLRGYANLQRFKNKQNI